VALLFAGLAPLVVEDVADEGDVIWVVARTPGPRGATPCGRARPATPPNLQSRRPPSPPRSEHRYARRSFARAGMRISPLAMCDQGVVPLVLAHARALLTSHPLGRTA